MPKGSIQGPLKSCYALNGSFLSPFLSRNVPKGSLWGLLRNHNVLKGSIGCTKPTLSVAIFKPFLQNAIIRIFSFLFLFGCIFSFSDFVFLF